MKKLALAIGVIVLPWWVPLPAVASAEAPSITFDQSQFPCQEDEVLGYAPQFGPDKVGCIHVDQIKG